MWRNFAYYNNYLKKLEDAFARDVDFLVQVCNSGVKFPEKEDPNYEYLEEKIETESAITTRETWQSKKEGTKLSRVSVSPKEPARTAKQIEAEIKSAVKVEDYELAAKLKSELLKMKKGEL